KCARTHSRRDEPDAVPGVVGCRCVVERERDAGDGLQTETEQKHASEREPPARTGRQRLVVDEVADLPETRAVVDPVGDAPPGPGARRAHSSTSMSEVFSLTRTLNVWSGRGGGPATTCPCRS